jgi:hypothetical protein
MEVRGNFPNYFPLLGSLMQIASSRVFRGRLLATFRGRNRIFQRQLLLSHSDLSEIQLQSPLLPDSGAEEVAVEDLQSV